MYTLLEGKKILYFYFFLKIFSNTIKKEIKTAKIVCF